jgi:WD40 repeat protein
VWTPAAAADGWDSLGRPDSELYRGARLDGTVEWRTATSPDLTATESAFLEADLVAQAEAQRRSNRRLRRALGGVAALLVFALVAGAVAFTQQRRAAENERAASLGRLVSNSAALRDSQRDLAALLAVEAHRLAPSADTESALFGIMSSAPGLERTVRPAEPYGGAGLLLDDETMALAGEDGIIHLVDVATGTERDRLSMGDGEGFYVALSLSADGRYLASAWAVPRGPGIGFVLTVWDLETQSARFPHVEVPFVGSMAINADASLVAVGDSTVGAVTGGEFHARVQMYDGATGALRAEIDPVPRPPDPVFVHPSSTVLFAPDGSLLVSSQAGPIRVVDPATGAELRRIDGPRDTSEGILRLSQDGRSLTTAGIDGVMRYDLASGVPLWSGPAGETCTSLQSVERLGVLLCGELSGRVLTLDLATGTVVEGRFDSQTGDVCGLMVDPAGTRLVVSTCSATSDYLVWRLDGSGPASRLAVDNAGEHSVIGYQPGGDEVVAELPVEPGELPVTHVIRADTGEIVDRLPGAYAPIPTDDPNVVFALFVEDGTVGRVGRYDRSRHALIGSGIAPGFEPTGLAMSGDRVLVWGLDKMAGLDPETGEVEAGLQLDHAGEILLAAADADHLLTVECDTECRVQSRDPQTGRSLTEPFALGFIPVMRDSMAGPLATGAGIFIVGTPDGQVFQIDPDSLTPMGDAFPETNGTTWRLVLSEDGRRLAVLGTDQLLRFYDVASRTQLGDPIPVGVGLGQVASSRSRGVKQPAAGVALREDGMEAAIDTDQGIVIWDLNPDHWADTACQIAGRNLTRAEWDQYIGDLEAYRMTCPASPAG